MIFCDTSTAAKLYVREAETEAVRQRLEAEDLVYASELVRVELMAVFHRRWREGKWSHADCTAAVRQFSADDLGGFWSWLPLDGAISESAARVYATLPEGVFLRSADFLHLMTALRHSFREIHTHDQHQVAAATTLGVKAVAITAVA